LIKLFFLKEKFGYKQRELVLLPFPFSDLTSAKVRPALVLSTDAYNATYDDVIVCTLTTNLSRTDYSVLIQQTDLENGVLKVPSRVKVDALIQADQSLILTSIGRLKASVFEQVLTIFVELVAQERVLVDKTLYTKWLASQKTP